MALRAKDAHSALPRKSRGKNSNWGLPLPIALSQQKNKAARTGGRNSVHQHGADVISAPAVKQVSSRPPQVHA